MLRKTAPVLCVLVVFALLASCGTTDPNATSSEDLSSYETWTKVNDETITGDATGTLGQQVHEGAGGFREVFVNSVGEPVFAGEASTPFPVGTIIVKESYPDAGGSKGDLSTLTVMVKREAGYDADNGDWEWVMLGPDMGIRTQGALASCYQCHAVAADTDYSFLAGDI